MKTQNQAKDNSFKLKLSKRTIIKLQSNQSNSNNQFFVTTAETGNSTVGICTVVETFNTATSRPTITRQ